jgi:tetratricopeptide (TPR) repeat protein
MKYKVGCFCRNYAILVRFKMKTDRNLELLMLLSVAFMLVILSPSSLFAIEGCDLAPHLSGKAQRAAQKDYAIQLYLEAIEQCPGFIRPYELLGNLYRNGGENEKAIAYFTKAAELGTHNYKLYYLLAKILYEKHDLDQAHRQLTKSLNIRQDYPEALKLKAKIEAAMDQEGPQIILFEPSTNRGLNLVYPYDDLTVRGRATDKSGISWIRVNELETPFDEDGNFIKDITVKIGTNTIIIEASDRVGNQSSLSVTVERKRSELPSTGEVRSSDLYGKSFAVVIGINRYEKVPALEFAVRDATAIRKRLEEIGFDQITMFLDNEATQRRILSDLFQYLPQKVSSNDRLLFYFAGHGETEDLPDGGKRGYILPVDADKSDLAGTAISMEQLRSLSSIISAKHILYVMDSCYSGLGLSRSIGASTVSTGFLRKVGSLRVVQIITAGGKGEQAQEKGGQGLFTRFFLKALDGEADINKDGVVTGTELGAYLRPIVSDASNQAQTPLYGRIEGEGEFLFFIDKK